jgi:hypothetical protein
MNSTATGHSKSPQPFHARIPHNMRNGTIANTGVWSNLWRWQYPLELGKTGLDAFDGSL